MKRRALAFLLLALVLATALPLSGMAVSKATRYCGVCGFDTGHKAICSGTFSKVSSIGSCDFGVANCNYFSTWYFDGEECTRCGEHRVQLATDHGERNTHDIPDHNREFCPY